MFRLDERFLADIGLGGLPPTARQSLLEKVYEQLTMLVGEELTRGLGDDLLDEFGDFSDRDRDAAARWLTAHVPDWEDNSPSGAELSTAEVCDLACSRWLQLHRPNYPAVVHDKLNDLRLELLENRDAIRAAFVPV